ncbi:MAG: AAA family ATPase [Patescibacteria group bacterium]|nr:AAA family ATPase [Patescibacteria group bacterium]
MRVAFLGKGGVGKTTLAAAMAKYLAKKMPLVLAIDADVNEHLNQALAIDKPLVFLGDHFDWLFDFLFKKRLFKISGLPRVGFLPPSTESRFIVFGKEDPVIAKFFCFKDNFGVAMVGSYSKTEIGAWCYHGRLNTLELFLHYLVDKKDQVLILDMNPGVDIVATSLYFACDVYLFVVEPTIKSLQVFLDFKKLVGDRLKKYKIQVGVIINKIYDEGDLEFISKYKLKDPILAKIPYFLTVVEPQSLVDQLVKDYSSLFDMIISQLVSLRTKEDYYRQLTEYFLSRFKEESVTKFIDPNFSFTS